MIPSGFLTLGHDLTLNCARDLGQDFTLNKFTLNCEPIYISTLNSDQSTYLYVEL